MLINFVSDNNKHKKFILKPETIEYLRKRDSSMIYTGWYLNDVKHAGMGDVKHIERLMRKDNALPIQDNTVFIFLALLIFLLLSFIMLFIRSKLKF